MSYSDVLIRVEEAYTYVVPSSLLVPVKTGILYQSSSIIFSLPRFVMNDPPRVGIHGS